MGYLRDTLYTSTYFHQRSKNRLTARRQPNNNLPAIYGNLTVICRILLYSAKLCQDHSLSPILLYICIDQATKLTIYTLFPRFLTFSPYATS